MHKVGQIMCRHRKALLEKFAQESTIPDADGKPRYVTFPQAKKACYEILCNELGTMKSMKDKRLLLSDEKLHFVFSPGQVPDPAKSMEEPLYDFIKILDLFKERYKTYL